MAAYLKRESILCHGTLLVSTNLEILVKALKLQKFKVTTLQKELGKEISMLHVISAILDAFNKVFNIDLELARLSKMERNIFREVVDSRIGGSLHDKKS